MPEFFNNSPNAEFQALFTVTDAINKLVELGSTEMTPGHIVEWISSNPAAFRPVLVTGTKCEVSFGPQVGTGSLTARQKDENGNIVETFVFEGIVVNHALPFSRKLSEVILIEQS